MKDSLTVRPGGITDLTPASIMMGNSTSCQDCGAPLRKGYEYCNVCGKRAAAPPATRGSVPGGLPKVLTVPAPKRRDGPKKPDNRIPRRELVIALMAMTCVAPFCTWLSSFGGLMGISAAFNEAFYGRYVVLLAAAGLLLMMAEDVLPAIIPRRAAIALIGTGTVALTAMDYVEIMRYNTLGPTLVTAMPGMGIYLALALGTAMALAVMVPQRRAKTLMAERPVIRPGSPGSGPSARR